MKSRLLRAKGSRSLNLISAETTLKADYLVIGAGVVGLAIALELKKRNPDARVLIVEKEEGAGLHASGRNSGVVHAGFYYSPDSLKAQLTVDGNASMKEYCLRNGLKLVTCGKVVVAQDETQVGEIEKLFHRGQANGVQLEVVNESVLRKIEPMAKTTKVALWSPNTAVADPSEVTQQLLVDLRSCGVEILYSNEVVKIEEQMVESSGGHKISFGHLINASGLYADRLAKLQGFGSSYSMLPFIGLYLYAPKLRGVLGSHIYPTPDPRNPFLGAHLTRTAADEVKIGPTAIPIVGREQYSFFEKIKLGEVLESLANYPKFLFSKHHDAWSLVRTELPKISAAYLRSRVAPIVQGLDLSQFTKRGRPGIRAQLFDLNQKKLEMDFVVEGNATSTHVLNAVSPGWTTCFSFACYVVDGIENRQKQ